MSPIGNIRIGLVFTLVCSVAAPFTTGDELPDNLRARGRQERVLAGIDVLASSAAQAKEELGVPTSEQGTFAEQKGIAGERTYVWQKPEVTITLKMEFIHDARLKGGFVESPEMITVEGSNGAIGKTGRGLRLGDAFSQVGRIYGSRFVKKANTIEIQWKSGNGLLITWDDKGLINKIELFAPE